MIHNDALVPFIVLGTISVLFITLGILIKYRKCYWLISGYNTASEDAKNSVDIKGVSSVVGNMLFLIAICLISASLSALYGYKQMVVIILTVFMPIIIVDGFIRLNEFSKHSNGSKKNMTLRVLLTSIIILMFIFMYIFSNIDPKIIINDNILCINDWKINMNEIVKIELSYNTPQIITKVSGLDFMDSKSGIFKVRGIDKGSLNVHLNSNPVIYIFTNGTYYIFNYKDSNKTNNAYNLLFEKWKKQ